MAEVDTSVPLQEAVKPYLNVKGPVSFTRDPINETAIRYYCEVAEDSNPVYWDEEFASSSRFGRIIAPPQSLFTMTFAPWWTPDFMKEQQAAEVADLNADVDTSASGMAGKLVGDYGYTTATMVGSEMEFLAPFGPGDGRIKSQGMTVDVSPPKKTRVGEGVFITSVTEYRTENGDRLIGRLKSTLLRYNSAEPRSD